MRQSNLKVRYNNIEVGIVPNPQYLQQGASKSEKNISEVISLDSHQIGQVEIYKSMDNNVTDIRVLLHGMDHTTITRLKEGKLIVRLSISAITGDGQETEGAQATSNSFVCVGADPKGVTNLLGTYPTMSYEIHLRSILRQRLEIENHLAFQLGGKGTESNAGTGSNPMAFLHTELTQAMVRAYTPNEFFTGNVNPLFDMVFTSTDPSVIVMSTPDSGFKMETDTNMKVLEFFFNHYPLFKTPFGWVIDDFVTQSNIEPSIIRIVDFLRHDTWKTNADTGLSNLLSAEIKSKTDSTILTSMQAAALLDLKPTARESFYNSTNFLFSDAFPLIYAQSIYDGTEIDTQAWNTMASTNYVLTSTKGGLRVKPMQNPMYREYITFMTGTEITQVQKFKNLFFTLHPELITYSLSNMWVGEVDLHKSIILKQESLTDDENYGYDRIGVGYRVKHTYTQTVETSATQDSDPREAAMKSPVFSLTSEITFLTLDDGPMSLSDFDKLQSRNVPEDQQFSYSDFTDYNTFNCGNGSPVNLGDYPTSEPGSPGNGSVAASAKTLIDHGFVYLWGGDRANAMDCSAFTMFSIRNAGADAGRPRRYPNGTTNQLNWLLDKKNGALVIPNKTQIQPGDIIFFRTDRGDHGHTAIAKSSTEYYHSSSVRKRGATTSSLERKTPSYIFRVLPFKTSDEKSGWY